MGMVPIICQNPFSGVHLYYSLILGSCYNYDVTTQRDRTAQGKNVDSAAKQSLNPSHVTLGGLFNFSVLIFPLYHVIFKPIS